MNILTFRKPIVAIFLVLINLTAAGCAHEAGIPLPANVRIDATAIEINLADAAELESLPGIGARTAAKIIEYRTANGPFRRTEQLMMVDGVSERKFRALREFVMVSSPSAKVDN